MKSFITLIESLTNSYLWKWGKFSEKTSLYSASHVASFRTEDDRKVFVMFYFKKNYVSAIFTVDGSEQITNEGGSFRILATVIAIINDFIEIHPDVEEIQIESKGQSRTKLYRSLLKRSAYDVIENEDGDGTIFKILV